MKNRRIIFLVVIINILLLFTGVSYGYFKTRIKSPGSKISVMGSNFSLNITDNSLTLSGVKPIYDKNKETQGIKKEFTISIGSAGVTSACYDLYIDVTSLGENLRNKYFKYEITNGTDTYTGSFDGKKDNSQILIIRNQNINTTNTSNSYTLYLWLSYIETEDQTSILTGDEVSRTFKGRVLAKAVTGACKETDTKPLTAFSEVILKDNPTISERTSFSSTNVADTTGTIYKTNKTEDGSDVYYYSGNTTNNWVKFGKYVNAGSYWNAGDDMYWRIIRTNEDGSVRILYSGTSPSTTRGYISLATYNDVSSNPMYVGYMRGTSSSLKTNRTNNYESVIKTKNDAWYESNLLTNYDKYISKTAIYCNDRSVESGTYTTEMSGSFDYGASIRVYDNKTPSYKCGSNTSNGLFETTQAVEDKFSASTIGGGNGQLKYPIALMTADELSFAGGVFTTNLSGPYAWYYKNSASASITGTSNWWTLTPNIWYNSIAYMASVGGSNYPGRLYRYDIKDSIAVRPVISLKACVKYSSGDGSSTNPYIVTIDSTCENEEN